jgi:hypothetical protein
MARVHVLAFKVLANMVVRNKRSEFYFTSHTVDDLSSEPTASGKQPQIDWARALKSQIPDLKTLAKGDGGVQTGKSWVKYIAHGEPITWIEGVMRWRLRSQEALQSVRVHHAPLSSLCRAIFQTTCRVFAGRPYRPTNQRIQWHSNFMPRFLELLSFYSTTARASIFF